jgi:hypothetical protein
MINTLIRGINSIPDIHIDNPLGPDVNIGIPNIGQITPIGGANNSFDVPLPPQRNITVNFNSTISTASPAEMQRAAMLVTSLVRRNL